MTTRSSGDDPALLPDDRSVKEPQLGGEAALQEIRQAIHSGTDDMAKAAIRRLYRIPGSAADQCLIDALDRQNPNIRSLAALVLSTRPSEKSAYALLVKLVDPDESVVRAILHSLAYHFKEIRNETLVRQIIQSISPFITGLDPRYLLTATQSLKNTGLPEAAPALLTAIRVADGHVHGAAWVGLRYIWETHQNEELRTQLLESLYAGVPDVSPPARAAMSRLIGQIEGDSALPRFREMLAAGDSVMHSVAIDAVSEIALLTSEQPVREVAVHCLGGALPMVEATLRGKIIDHFRYLGQRDTKSFATLVVPYLVDCLADKEEGSLYSPPLKICVAAAHALEKIDTQQAKSALAVYRESRR